MTIHIWRSRKTWQICLFEMQYVFRLTVVWIQIWVVILIGIQVFCCHMQFQLENYKAFFKFLVHVVPAYVVNVQSCLARFIFCMWYLAIEDRNEEGNYKEFSFGDLFHKNIKVSIVSCKGQLISKCLIGSIVLTKKPTKFF